MPVAVSIWIARKRQRDIDSSRWAFAASWPRTCMVGSVRWLKSPMHRQTGRLFAGLKSREKTSGDHEMRFAMTSRSLISRLAAPLIALVLTVAASGWPVHAVEDARKVSVVSFGLFGDQGVFRRE